MNTLQRIVRDSEGWEMLEDLDYKTKKRAIKVTRNIHIWQHSSKQPIRIFIAMAKFYTD